MWDLLQSIQEQVTKYSTWLGQLWYLCVFVFRLIVVVTIGDAVYGDEQSEFVCNTREPGCTNMCFNVFSKISHIRFWAFQLLAVATPTVLFHFYSLSVTSQIEKNKEEQKVIEEEKNKVDRGLSVYSENGNSDKQHHKLEKRKKKVGNVKIKKIYSGGKLTEVPYTSKIHIAYYISVAFRLALEAVFIYLAYQLFKFMDIAKIEEIGPLDFVWFSVPSLYLCSGEIPAIKTACHQSVLGGSHATCWVSRPWEKTILVRYMNILSAICFVLSCTELVYLSVKAILWWQKMPKRFQNRNSHLHSPSYGTNAYSTVRTVTPAANIYNRPPTIPPSHLPQYEYAQSVNQTEHMIPLRILPSDAMSVVTEPIESLRLGDNGSRSVMESRMNFDGYPGSEMMPMDTRTQYNAHVHHD